MGFNDDEWSSLTQEEYWHRIIEHVQKSIEQFKREVRKTFGNARFFIYEAGELEEGAMIMANSDITKLVYRVKGDPIVEGFY